MRRIPREARLLRRPVRSPGDPPGRQQKPIATFVQYEDLHSIARNQLLNLYDVTLRRRGIPGHRPLQHWRKLDPRPPDKNLVREPTGRPADPDGRPNLIAPHRTTNSSTTSPTNESPATVHSQRTHTPTQGTHTPTNPTQCQLSPTPIVTRSAQTTYTSGSPTRCQTSAMVRYRRLRGVALITLPARGDRGTPGRARSISAASAGVPVAVRELADTL